MSAPATDTFRELVREVVREEYAALFEHKSPIQPVLTIREACSLMKWSYSWAVRHWDELGGYRDLDGKLKIKPDLLAKHPKISLKSARQGR